MAQSPFILQEHQFQRLKSVIARLCVECAARVVFLVDRDGQTIAFHGAVAVLAASASYATYHVPAAAPSPLSVVLAAIVYFERGSLIGPSFLTRRSSHTFASHR